MNFRRCRVAPALTAAALTFAVAAQPLAGQSLAIGGSDSNYGAAKLSAGFSPDPHQVSITSGGSLDVGDMNLGSGCVGYGTRNPDFILNVGAGMSFLRFYNEGNGDTGLVINDPNGRWHCDDDSHTGTNPMVSIENASGGQYDIWVTSYSSDDNIASTLYITELRSNPAGSSTERLSIGGDDSNFGSVTLSPGFTPDPHEVNITSGGSLSVREMNLGSGCVGYATRTPDFILEFSGASDFLRFYMEGNGDTGLVINGPSGRWHCDDDSHTGTNPMVDITNAEAGQYDIWVSSYSSDENITGTLHITERRSLNTKGN